MQNLVTKVDHVINDKYINSIYEYDGMKVPRVTEILNKCIHVDSLMGWANSLGFRRQSYKAFMDRASNIGSVCHDGIDMFLDTGIELNTEILESNNAYLSFRKWFDDIKSFQPVEIVMHEHKLTCRYFGGTLDGLYKIGGKLYLVDYKTSNHITYKYCLQLAAYRKMLREEHGIELAGCIIVQLSKNEVCYTEYPLLFDNPEHLKFIDDCENAFLSLVLAYFNITYIENEYKRLGWKS